MSRNYEAHANELEICFLDGFIVNGLTKTNKYFFDKLGKQLLYQKSDFAHENFFHETSIAAWMFCKSFWCMLRKISTCKKELPARIDPTG